MTETDEHEPQLHAVKEIWLIPTEHVDLIKQVARQLFPWKRGYYPGRYEGLRILFSNMLTIAQIRSVLAGRTKLSAQCATLLAAYLENRGSMDLELSARLAEYAATTRDRRPDTVKIARHTLMQKKRGLPF